jgi:hypothetical protein
MVAIFAATIARWLGAADQGEGLTLLPEKPLVSTRAFIPG